MRLVSDIDREVEKKKKKIRQEGECISKTKREDKKRYRLMPTTKKALSKRRNRMKRKEQKAEENNVYGRRGGEYMYI